MKSQRENPEVAREKQLMCKRPSNRLAVDNSSKSMEAKRQGDDWYTWNTEKKTAN